MGAKTGSGSQAGGYLAFATRVGHHRVGRFA